MVKIRLLALLTIILFIWSISSTSASSLNTPTNLQVVESTEDYIRLQWNDTNTIETGYRLEHSIDNVNWQILSITSANGTSAYDYPYFCNIQLYYRVAAVNETTGEMSAYSSVRSHVTYACPNPLVLNVNRTTDGVDANPGNGVCAISGGGCTLRAAIMEANARAGVDVINIPAGTYQLTRAGQNEDNASTGDLDVTDDLVIMGASAATTIINGNAYDRVFDIFQPTVIQYVTIRNGQTSGHGGGIRNQAVDRTPFWTAQEGLYLDNVIITNNTASGNGGGIANYGYFILLSSQVVNNTALNGGGVYHLFFENLDNLYWSVMYSSTIANNTAHEAGGGMYIGQGEPGGVNDLRLWTLTINNNRAKNGGGVAIFAATEIWFDTVTISDNEAEEYGGGIIADYYVNLAHTTVADNVADSDNNGIGSGGGIALTFINSQSYASVHHTILAGNRLGNNNADNCYDSEGDIIGANMVALYNLLGSLGNCTYGVWDPDDPFNPDPPESNILSDNPMLMALADNGGMTKTRALQAGSPAIDEGRLGTYPCQMFETLSFIWDQRGIERVGACDIGAYEYANPATSGVTTLFATLDYATPLSDNYIFTSLEESLNGMVVISRRMLRQDAYSPSANSITHPDNMRLVWAGANGIMDTNNCSSIVSDDVLVTEYFAGGLGFVHAARSPVNLPNGKYRLIICGNVVDAEGVQIDGNGDGIAGGNFIYNFIVAVGLSPLEMPGDLQSSGSALGSITLQWTDTNTDESGYRIQRSTDSLNWQIIGTTAANATSFVDNGVTICNITYYYRVFAIDAIGRVSENATVEHSNPCPVLAAPTNLQVTGTTLTTIDLQWTDNANNESGFIIERSSNGGTSWTQISTRSANITTYSNTFLSCGVNYMYRVAAVLSFYNLKSAYSNSVPAATQDCPTPPATPTGLTVTGTTLDSIMLEWTDNSTTETGFILQRWSIRDDSTWTEIVTLPANTTSYTDIVGCGASFNYRVFAINRPHTPDSAMSNIVGPVVQACPAAPANFNASVNGDTITLTWTDGSTIETSYKLLRFKDFPSLAADVIYLPANATGYVDDELSCFTRYRYYVQVVVSDIVYSDYAITPGDFTTDCAPPIAPTNLSVTNVQRRSFTVTWNDNSNIEAQYILEYSTDGSTWNTPIPLPPNTTTFAYGNLPCSAERFVRVRSVRSPQNLYSDYTNTVNTTTMACPALTTPATPNLDSVGATEIRVAWPSDFVGEASHTYLERRTNSGNWQQIASLPVATTGFFDSNLSCATNYEYRTRYYRAEDGAFSQYSNTLVTSTIACPTPVEHTVGLYKNGVWQFSAVNDASAPDITFNFGPTEAGWTPLVGDWDGDGVDGIGVYKDGIFILRNGTSSITDVTFTFGAREAGWQPVVGDWNGDGLDTVGVYKDGLVMLTNSHVLLGVDYRFRLGDGTAGWFILAGDWDYSGADSVGLYRAGYFYLTNTLDGNLRRPFSFGPTQSGWLPLSGDWNSDGIDSIGVYNQSIWRLRNANSAGTVDLGFNFGARETGWIPLASYRGGSTPLMALASAANVHTNIVSEPPVVPTQPPVLLITPEVTQEIPSAEVTPEPTAIPTLEPTPEITVEPTVVIEPTLETSAPVEVTSEPLPEVTQAPSEP